MKDTQIAQDIERQKTRQAYRYNSYSISLYCWQMPTLEEIMYNFQNHTPR